MTDPMYTAAETRPHSSRAQVIDMIEAIPEEERLDYCIHLLRFLSCDDASVLAHYQANFDMPPTSARFAHFVASRAPRVCTREQIYAALYDPDTSPVGNVLSVYACHIRRAGIALDTVWGEGYSMSEEEADRIMPKECTAPPFRGNTNIIPSYRGEPMAAGRKWTVKDDALLIELTLSGEWTRLAICGELERTERGVSERLTSIFGTCAFDYIQANASTIEPTPNYVALVEQIRYTLSKRFAHLRNLKAA